MLDPLGKCPVALGNDAADSLLQLLKDGVLMICSLILYCQTQLLQLGMIHLWHNSAEACSVTEDAIVGENPSLESRNRLGNVSDSSP